MHSKQNFKYPNMACYRARSRSTNVCQFAVLASLIGASLDHLDEVVCRINCPDYKEQCHTFKFPQITKEFIPPLKTGSQQSTCSWIIYYFKDLHAFKTKFLTNSAVHHIFGICLLSKQAFLHLQLV